MPGHIAKLTKTDPSTEFYEDDQFKQYLIENYILDGKLIVNVDISPDGLEKTIYMEFLDADAFRLWANDLVVTENKIKQGNWNLEHGIKVEVTPVK
jgi:hypothetical protein